VRSIWKFRTLPKRCRTCHEHHHQADDHGHEHAHDFSNKFLLRAMQTIWIYCKKMPILLSVCTVCVLMFGLYLNPPFCIIEKVKNGRQFNRPMNVLLLLFMKNMSILRGGFYDYKNLPPVRPFLTSGIVEKNHRSKSRDLGCLVGIWCHGRHDWCHGHDWSSCFFRWWKLIPWLLAVFKDPNCS